MSGAALLCSRCAPAVQVDRSSPQASPKKAGSVFSVACGSHTHFFAAPSPAEAKVGARGLQQPAWGQEAGGTGRHHHALHL